MAARHPHRRPRPNDERDRRIAAMVQGGASLKETAEAFSLSIPRIQQIISIQGVQARRKLSPHRDRIVEMVEDQGMSMRQIGAELGLSNSRVSRIYRDEMARRGMEGDKRGPIP